MGPGSLTGPLLGLEAHHGADECPSGSPRGSQHCETNSDRTVHRNQRIVSQSDCSDNSLRGSLITDEFTHTSDLPASNKTSKYGKLVPRNGDGNHLQALQCQTEAQSKGEDLGQSEIDDDLKSHMLLAQSLTTTEASCKSTSEDDSTSHEKENTVSAGQDGKGDSLFFARWMTTLRRKNFERHHTTIPRIERWVLDDFDPELNGLLTSAGSPSGGTHQKSYSGTSSLKFISAVKSASVTLASASLAPLSRKSRQILRAKSEHWRSGISDTQGSIDSGNNLYVERMADEGAWLRSFQRRNILDELLDSEEYYIKDIKALDNVRKTLKFVDVTL